MLSGLVMSLEQKMLRFGKFWYEFGAKNAPLMIRCMIMCDQGITLIISKYDIFLHCIYITNFFSPFKMVL